MKKFSDVLETLKYTDLEEKFKSLFIDTWLKILGAYNIKLFRLNYENQYSQISIFTLNRFNESTYSSYKDFFDFCIKNNLKFSFSSTTNKESVITVFVDSLEDIIKEMELLKETDKYNL